MKKLLLPLLFVLGGCSHSIHMVNTAGFNSNDLPSHKKAKYVEARSEQNVVLGFAFDTDYVDDARASLLAQCPGEIKAVSSQFSTSHGFLYWTNKVFMKGVCVN